LIFSDATDCSLQAEAKGEAGLDQPHKTKKKRALNPKMQQAAHLSSLGTTSRPHVTAGMRTLHLYNHNKESEIRSRDSRSDAARKSKHSTMENRSSRFALCSWIGR